MKIVGIIFISIGLALMLFVLYTFMSSNDRLISPLPHNEGVKVIFVTPTK